MDRGSVSKPIVFNDEPTTKDELGRGQYAESLARLVETCETPLVIGLYGNWGAGKTSFMKQIETQLDCEKVRSVWFNPWLLQSHESPVLAISYLISHIPEVKGKRRKLPGAGLNKGERSLVCDARMRLRDGYRKTVETWKSKSKRRVVIFIDDLERCSPDYMLSVLESLKLYLNVQGCIYFLGVDPQAIKSCLQERYKGLDMAGARYIEKVIQLHFNIPPVPPETMEKFIASQLSQELRSCQAILVKGLDDNPRQIKRFINTLTLNHQLASGTNIHSYNQTVMATLLLIQQRHPELYQSIVKRPGLLRKLTQKTEEGASIRKEWLSGDTQLQDVLGLLNLPEEIPLDIYGHLTQMTGANEQCESPSHGNQLKAILREHESWLFSKGKEGKQADLSEADLSETDVSDANLCEARLSKTNLSGADLSKANLSKADMAAVDLTSADVPMADLSMADLRSANFSKANLSRANLSVADLSRANLYRANLAEANLHGAKLSGANLSEAILHLADLSETDLSDASLSRADLSRANLTEALLAGTDLTRANLFGAILTETVGLTIVQINSAMIDSQTVLPDYLDKSGKTELDGH
jgi:uncharacterized protein YjbI with pentapeptide repeats